LEPEWHFCMFCYFLSGILFITKAPRNFKFFRRYIVLGNPVESGTLSVGNLIWPIGLSLCVQNAASSWRLLTFQFHMHCAKRIASCGSWMCRGYCNIFYPVNMLYSEMQWNFVVKTWNSGTEVPSSIPTYVQTLKELKQRTRRFGRTGRLIASSYTTTPYRSAHKGNKFNNGVDCSPRPPNIPT